MGFFETLKLKIKLILWPWLKSFLVSLCDDILLPALQQIGKEGVQILIRAILEAESQSNLKGPDKFQYAFKYAKKHLNVKEVLTDDTLNTLIQTTVSFLKKQKQIK